MYEIIRIITHPSVPMLTPHMSNMRKMWNKYRMQNDADIKVEELVSHKADMERLKMEVYITQIKHLGPNGHFRLVKFGRGLVQRFIHALI